MLSEQVFVFTWPTPSREICQDKFNCCAELLMPSFSPLSILRLRVWATFVPVLCILLSLRKCILFSPQFCTFVWWDIRLKRCILRTILFSIVVAHEGCMTKRWRTWLVRPLLAEWIMLINKTGSTCQSGGQRQILIRRSFSDCLDVCRGRAHSEQVTEQRPSRSELCGRRYVISLNDKWHYLRTGCSVINAVE